ncbi:MAG TPA: beta-galactosidase [Spirochaetia bacterium]|nr:beta-galactosidase [Spirochaetia bacterium]
MTVKNHHQRGTGLEYFLFGSDYYPEQWDAATRSGDIDRMREAGFNCVRMGESGWSLIESAPGRFDFRFFDEQIDALGAAGIRTILGTPTAAPPIWLSQLYPEVLRVDVEGRRMAHGSRQHACYSSPRFRERSVIVVRALAEHYRENANVVGWQLDNAYSLHDRECFCDSCRERFRRFLEKKYGSPEELNRAWGTAFWSQTYSAFAQIDPPFPARPAQENPAASLDYRLFLNASLVEFQHAQVELLRAANPAWWVTHNFVLSGMDYLALTAELDFAGFSYYPLFAAPPHRGALGAAALDTVRSFDGNFILPELQSGPAGRGDYRQDTPHPGQTRLFAYQAVGRGADGILHFRFRTARSGAEQSWGGILGDENGARFEEVCREGREFARLGPLLRGSTISPEIGILVDYGLPELSHRPVTLGLPSPAECGWTIHRTFYDAGYSVGFVNPLDSFSSFKLLVLPAWPIIEPDLFERLSTYVQLGGTLLVTARTGIKDVHSNMLAEAPPGPLSRLAGIRVSSATRINYPDLFPNEIRFGLNDADAPEIASMIPGVRQSLWLECLSPEDDSTDVLGRWTEPPVAERPALTLHRFGLGKVRYVGTFPDARNFKPLLFPLAGEANLVPFVSSLTPGIEISVRENNDNSFYFVLNHTPVETLQRGLPGGELIIGPPKVQATRQPSGTLDLMLSGYDVAVIQIEKAAKTQ